MASIARDNLDIIRIPRKVIVAELVKKLGGSAVQYQNMFENGRYWSIARTVIATREVNTSGKLEQAMGCLDTTIEGAEEEAAIALIEVLKRTYRFEIDDVNLMKRAKAEHRNEQLEKQMLIAASTQNTQSEKIEKLSKGWNQLLDDIDFVQETYEKICGTAFASLGHVHTNGPLADVTYSMHLLNEWTEEKIYENTARLNCEI